MNKISFVALCLLAGVIPGLAYAQPVVEQDFSSVYEQYTASAAKFRDSVQSGTATLAQQKEYFTAVVQIFSAQNKFLLKSLPGLEDVLKKDAHALDDFSNSITSANNEEAMRAVAVRLAEYISSYTSQVRQPALVLFTGQFVQSVLVPAQERYNGMKQAVDAAKLAGKNTGAYETALQDIRLKLYEVKGLTDDVQSMLSDESFSLDQIDADMNKAQEIIKEIYSAYKDLSLRSGSLFAR